jgi:hypothetical protein
MEKHSYATMYLFHLHQFIGNVFKLNSEKLKKQKVDRNLITMPLNGCIFLPLQSQK